MSPIYIYIYTDIVHSHYLTVTPWILPRGLFIFMSPIYRGILHSRHYPMVFPSQLYTRTLFTVIILWFFQVTRNTDIVHSHYPMAFPCHRYTRILFTVIIIPWSSHLSYILAHCSRSLSKWSIIQVTRNTDIVHSHYPMVFPCRRYTRILFTVIIIPWFSHETEIHGHCSQSPLFTASTSWSCYVIKIHGYFHSHYIMVFPCHRYTRILFTIIIIL